MSRNKDFESNISIKLMSGKRYSVTIAAKLQNKSLTTKQFGLFCFSELRFGRNLTKNE